MIYFIQCQSTNNIKIGFTDGDPDKRKAELQTGSAAGLNLLFAMPGDRATEKAWHSKFSADRVHGEWFKPTGELLCRILDESRKIAFDQGVASVPQPAKKFEQETQLPRRPLFIYLAGSISKTNWRETVVDGLRGCEGVYCKHGCSNYDMASLHEDWPVLKKSILGVHHYVGPFFIRCVNEHTHDCDCYSPCSHGVAAEAVYEGREGVVQICLDTIRKADLVFSWISREDCFGTIAELGYAKAIGKTVVVAGPELFKDMWFLHHMADFSVFSDKSPREILRNVLETSLRWSCKPTNGMPVK